MTRISRPYAPGDEVQINQMYKRITGADRTDEEYSWEWLETWAGQANIWLEFDDERDEHDQLIAQYSLIPTPFSFFGRKVDAAKTENCMSHPDFRGKGMYFFHEKKYFKEAQSLFDMFFTTAGHVAKGAPGKIRAKLGYLEFGHWVSLSLWLNRAALEREILSNMPGILKSLTPIKKIISWGLSKIFTASSNGGEPSQRIAHFDDGTAPFGEMVALWKRSTEDYGITIDRTEEYLRWRLAENPYLHHKVLLFTESSMVRGYLIYTVQDEVYHIVDMIVEGLDRKVFAELFNALKHEVIKGDGSQIKVSTSSVNQRLLAPLRQNGFRNFKELFSFGKADLGHNQIYVYLKEELQKDPRTLDSVNWYFTDLMKEGRPYRARLIN